MIVVGRNDDQSLGQCVYLLEEKERWCHRKCSELRLIREQTRRSYQRDC